MASDTRFSYQKLPHSSWLDEDDDFRLRERVIGRAKSWPKVRNAHIKRRLVRVRIPSLKRFLKRKTRVISASWAKVVKRFREGQAHFGDIFAGNYMFMQITPTPFDKYGDKYLKGYDLGGLSYNNYIARISSRTAQAEKKLGY